MAKYDFKYTKGLICRAHFVGRMETSKEIFNKKIPREKFFERYFKTDATAIALKSENRAGGPSQYIPIDPELKLFSSTMAGFRHGPSERQYLRDLHAAYKAGKVTLCRALEHPAANEQPSAPKVVEPAPKADGKQVFEGTIGKKKYLLDAGNGEIVMEPKTGASLINQAATINRTLISRNKASKYAVNMLFKRWRQARDV